MEQPIVGHDRIITQLQHAIRLNRIAGAYLFVGPAGVGKETVATHFAKSINCLKHGESACGNCISCRKTDVGNHPDTQIVHPSGAWIKIDQIRELQTRIVYRPLEGVRKIVILKEAERMNLEAANALLKTLEEPPAESVLILLTTNLDALLPTIRSRCQIIKFIPLTQTELGRYLSERFHLAEREALAVATLAGGAVGRALSYLESRDTEESESNQHVDEEIPEILTTTDRLAAFRIAEHYGDNPDELDSLVEWYRDLLLLHQDVPPDLLTHIYHVDALKRLVPHYSRYRLQSAIKTIFETKNALGRNINATLALEVMALKLMSDRT
ncbi:MAG: DNA polymerase III subunit delta' [Candidatus Poribacteria bacterium]|nr:DNA polymerase III subunit delta' [Candidatus Poribacteria bacterium]MDE0505042.1 DNA polymerase III subunit delta' [Candidatus Poribacteria bacterium]